MTISTKLVSRSGLKDEPQMYANGDPLTGKYIKVHAVGATMRVRNVISILLLSCVYLFIFNHIGGLRILDAMTSITWWSVTLATLALMVAVLSEYVRWVILIRSVDKMISHWTLFPTFLTGYVLIFLPSKSGEMVRYVYLHKRNVPFQKTIPIHFITNLLNLAVILLFTVPVFTHYGQMSMFWGAIGTTVITLGILRYPTLFLQPLKSVRWIKDIKAVQHLRTALKSSRNMMSWRNLTKGGLLTALHYLALWGIIYAMASPLTDISPWFIFGVIAFSLIASVLSALPLGGGIIEIVSISLLSTFMTASTAAALVISFRVISVGLTSLMGLCALLYLRGR